ncbi:MAG: hypothetical protein AMXMBFR26_02530 [Porticoccaceae bacterium]
MNAAEPPSGSSWLKRIARLLRPRPRSREDVAQLLEAAHQDALLDSQSFDIMKGAFQLARRQAHEIMVPRAHMVVIRQDLPLTEVATRVIEAKHSRYPVIGESLDDIRGILLAKDLLPLLLERDAPGHIHGLARPATIVPETKRLDVLLREFREQRYHMAIVVDEYGGVAGLITIEDILEEIVGDIEDETDLEAGCDIRREPDGSYRVAALTSIADFNRHFGTQLANGDVDTLGGLVCLHAGRLPEVGERIALDDLVFTVLAGDERQLSELRVERVPPPESG